MKQSPQLAAIQECMRPGVITAHGFLGADARALAEIIEADGAQVARLGLTHASIAARMRSLHAAGAAGLGEFIDVPPHFEVRVDAVRGKIPCPFGDRALEQKGFTVVRNASLGREVTFTALHVHLIEAHGFYQGAGSPFRLEPADLAVVLGIEPT
jgi:hypothetical protein